MGVCRVLCVDLMWLLLPTYLNMERVRMLNHNLWIMCRTEDFICKIKVAYYCGTFGGMIYKMSVPPCSEIFTVDLNY